MTRQKAVREEETSESKGIRRMMGGVSTHDTKIKVEMTALKLKLLDLMQVPRDEEWAKGEKKRGVFNYVKEPEISSQNKRCHFYRKKETNRAREEERGSKKKKKRATVCHELGPPGRDRVKKLGVGDAIFGKDKRPPDCRLADIL